MGPDSGFMDLFPDYPGHWRTERSEDRGADAMLAEIDKSARRGVINPKLVSSYAGRIEEILFTFPDYAATDTASGPAYRSVIAALPKGTRFTVVHPDAYADVFRQWFSDAGHPETNVTYVPVRDTLSFNDWAEDPYVALYDKVSGTQCLMEPYEFHRDGDALIAEAVQEHTDITAGQATLIFQGGNCLIGDDFWLLGRDYIEDTVDLFRRPRPPVHVPPEILDKPAELEQFARTEFRDSLDRDRKLHVVGLDTMLEITASRTRGLKYEDRYLIDIPHKGIGRYQPIFHIDMFVTLVGHTKGDKFTVMVGSPALSVPFLDFSSDYALDWAYDELAAQLESFGFRVVRNPIVHWPTPGKIHSLGAFKDDVYAGKRPGFKAAIDDLVEAGAKDNDPVETFLWHHVTWNNCLVENNGPGQRRVYMPTFGHTGNEQFAPLDDEMERLWCEEGFEVVRLGDFNEFAKRDGVVHCIKKYLARSAAPAMA